MFCARIVAGNLYDAYDWDDFILSIFINIKSILPKFEPNIFYANVWPHHLCIICLAAPVIVFPCVCVHLYACPYICVVSVFAREEYFTEKCIVWTEIIF